MKGWPGEPDMDYDVLVADGEAAANAGKPITDVIFDFGNVLIYWDPVGRTHPPLQPEDHRRIPRQRHLRLLRCQRPDGRRHQHRRGHRHHAP